MSFSSIVQDFGPSNTSCGYCGGDDSCRSHGMWAHKVNCLDYGSLLDRGWRRAGNWCYKPELAASCCQQYTIRLDACRFEASKAQRRVLRRLRAWLEGGGKRSRGDDGPGGCDHGRRRVSGRGERGADEASVALAAACSAVLRDVTDERLPLGFTLRVNPTTAKQAAKLPPSVRFTSPSAFPAAAAARRSSTPLTPPSPQLIATCVAEALNKAASASNSALAAVGFERAEAADGHINFHVREDAIPVAMEGVQEGEVREGPGKAPAVVNTAVCQAGGDEAPATEPQKSEVAEMPGLTPMAFLGAGGSGCRLTAEMERSNFNEEEFALYFKYQTTQHGDPPEKVRRGSYIRFLVENPFPKSDGESPSGEADSREAPPCGYGAFHIKYRVDGRLIAVSVVDVLPACLSSKYFFWDPDYAALSLGKFSALFEIAWVQEIRKQTPKLHYYYLGYYIHNCGKMRYKADYSPSDLLCPRRYVWVPYAKAAPALDASPSNMVVLSDLLLSSGTLTNAKQPRASEAPVSETSEAQPEMDWSSNSRQNFSEEEVMSTVLLNDGELSLLSQLKDYTKQVLTERIRAWYFAVGSPARTMVYVLSHSALSE